jgi:uncharacterized protein
MAFHARARHLPRLGFGISTEHGAGQAGTAPLAARHARPDLVSFLEIGADVARGFDADSLAWVQAGLPTTYHFLDLNLEEPEDLDERWLAGTLRLARQAGAAWLCGDAGLWHVGPRDHGHGTLLPPIFCASSLASMVEAVIALRERSGMEVLPENPPAQVLLGDLHPLEYFGALAERADCGLLLDVSHLAIVQRALGLAPTTLLSAFPVDRVVEIHVAGGSLFTSGGRQLLHDDHGTRVHDDTWRILEEVIRRATALRAIVVEGERNSLPEVVTLFAEVQARVGDQWGYDAVVHRSPPAIGDLSGPPIDHRRVQRTLFRMLVDPAFAQSVRQSGPEGLESPASDWLRTVDLDLLAADPDEARLRQLLGNVVLEFVHTVRAAPGLVVPFAASPELHRAIAEDTPLPFAFAAYAHRELPADGLARADPRRGDGRAAPSSGARPVPHCAAGADVSAGGTPRRHRRRGERAAGGRRPCSARFHAGARAGDRWRDRGGWTQGCARGADLRCGRGAPGGGAAHHRGPRELRRASRGRGSRRGDADRGPARRRRGRSVNTGPGMGR